MNNELQLLEKQLKNNQGPSASIATIKMEFPYVNFPTKG
jgi:hypothetical protein